MAKTTGNRPFTGKQIALLLASLHFVASLFYPLPGGLSRTGVLTLSILALAVVLWMTDTVPLVIALLSMMFLFTLCGITTPQETAGQLGSDTMWLIIAMLVISYVVTRTPLPRRLAYRLLSLCRGNVYLSLLALMSFCFLLSIFIPSSTGKALLAYPISIEVCRVLEQHGLGNLRPVVVPSVTLISTVSSFCFITGSPTTFAAAELFERTLNYHWTYFGWIKAFAPIGIAATLLFWAVLARFYFPRRAPRVDLALGRGEDGLGSPTPAELRLIGLYLLLFVLWGTKNLTGISMATSACVVMCLLFFPKIQIAPWKECMTHVDWGIPLITTAGLSVAVAMGNSGVTTLITHWMQGTLTGLSPWLILVALALIVVVVRLPFINNVMMTAMFLPIVFSIAAPLGFAPLWLGMFALQFINVSTFVPTQSIEGVAVFSYGDYTAAQHTKVGIPLGIILTVCILSTALFYWPAIGFTLY